MLCFQWWQLAAAQWRDWRALQRFRGTVNSPQKQVLVQKQIYRSAAGGGVPLQSVRQDKQLGSAKFSERVTPLSRVCYFRWRSRVPTSAAAVNVGPHHPSSPPPPLCVIRPVASTLRSICAGTRVSWHTNGPPWKRSGNTRPDTEPLLQRTFNIWRRRDEKHCVLATVGLCGKSWRLFFSRGIGTAWPDQQTGLRNKTDSGGGIWLCSILTDSC